MGKDKILHASFILSLVVYGALGYLIPPTSHPTLPPQYAMLYLSPGVIAALVGIAFYRKGKDEEEKKVLYWLIGDALVEVMAIMGLLIFLLTGERLPLFTGAGLGILVMLMNIP